MAREYVFPVILTRDDVDGGFVITCPDLPEVVTQADDVPSAIDCATDAVEEAVAGRLRRGEEVPLPGRGGSGDVTVALPPVMTAKVALTTAMREAGTTKTRLAEVLGVDEMEVRRLLDPRHPSKMARLERALKSLGKGLVVRVVDRVA